MSYQQDSIKQTQFCLGFYVLQQQQCNSAEDVCLWIVHKYF